MTTEREKLAIELTKKFTDAGLIIEAGFAGFKLMAYSSNLPAAQEEELRNTFFAGAQHLFSSIMNVLDSGEEPTESDLNRITLIDNELKKFISAFEFKHLKTKGSA